jgi:hypothetical protein
LLQCKADQLKTEVEKIPMIPRRAQAAAVHQLTDVTVALRLKLEAALRLSRYDGGLQNLLESTADDVARLEESLAWVEELLAESSPYLLTEADERDRRPPPD